MSCPHEERLLRAAAADVHDAWVAQHAGECADCALALEISRWMLEMEGSGDTGGGPDPAARIPSVGQIWWKAQVAAREAAARRALRPVRLVESAAVAVTLVGGGAALFAVLRRAPALLESSMGSSLPGLSGGALSPAAIIAMGVAAFITTLAVHRLLARD